MSTGEKEGRVLRSQTQAAGAATAPPVQVDPPAASETPVASTANLQQLLLEIARRQEEQARRQEEALQEACREKEEQARRHEELKQALAGLQVEWKREILDVYDRLDSCSMKVESHDKQLVHISKKINQLELGISGGTSSSLNPVAAKFKLPPYDGTSSWSAYKLQLEAVTRANGWNEEQARTALTLGLRDGALTVLEALGEQVSYEQLLEALEARYGDGHLEHAYRAQLKDRSQRHNESLQQWAVECEKLVRKAYKSAAPEFINSLLLQNFIDGIRNTEVRAAVRLHHPLSLKDAVAHALEVETVRQEPHPQRLRRMATDEVDSQRVFRPRCYQCGGLGHIRMDCPKRNRRHGNEGGGGLVRNLSFAAGKRINASTEGRVLAGDHTVPIVISQVCGGNSLVIDGRVNGKMCHCVVDTGASRSILNPRILSQRGGPRPEQHQDIRLLAATGQRIPVRGVRKVAINLGNEVYQHEVILADIVDDCILGLDFLKNYNCAIELGNNVLRCGSVEIPMNNEVSGQDHYVRRTTWPSESKDPLILHASPSHLKEHTKKIPGTVTKVQSNLVTEHRSGKAHGNAEPLSRQPCPVDGQHCTKQEEKENVAVRVIRTDDSSEEWSNELMARAQQEVEDMINKMKQNLTDYVHSLRKRLDDVHHLIRESEIKVGEKMKTRYDRATNTPGYETGTLVWLHNPSRRKGKSPKLQNRWEGPYTIMTKINDVTYRIRRTERTTPKIVHVDRLARFHGNTPA